MNKKADIPDFLTHYYEKASGPFKSMTDEGANKAREIFSLLKTGKGAKSNFSETYIDQRAEVEAWLRSSFIRKGGKPVRQNPIYTILGSCDWLLEWYETGAKETISLSALNEKQVSFTYPDSMVSYQLFKAKEDASFPYPFKEHYGQVYHLEELNNVISRYGLPQGKIINGKPEPDIYIEVQIWEYL